MFQGKKLPDGREEIKGETITFVVDPSKKTFTKKKPMGCAVSFADYDVTNISKQKYR